MSGSGSAQEKMELSNGSQVARTLLIDACLTCSKMNRQIHVGARAEPTLAAGGGTALLASTRESHVLQVPLLASPAQQAATQRLKVVKVRMSVKYAPLGSLHLNLPHPPAATAHAATSVAMAAPCAATAAMMVSTRRTWLMKAARALAENASHVNQATAA